MKKFYHVTDTANVKSILATGLKGGTKPRNRGQKVNTPSIYVIIDHKITVKIATNIAINQVWPDQDVKDFAIIEIDSKGIRKKNIKPDNVAEQIAVFHRVIEQDMIEPKYLRLHSIQTINYPGRTLLEMTQVIGKRKWTEAEWELAMKYLPPVYHQWAKAAESDPKTYKAWMDGAKTIE